MRLPLIRGLPRRSACWLCLFIPVLAGCGDYCLFCDGDGGGNGNGNGTTTVCDRPFPGADAFVQVNIIDTFLQQEDQDDRQSLALIPKGMSFEYGTPERTAEPGDLVLADPQASSIYLYEYPSTTRQTLLTGYNDVTGLALLHQEIATDTYADFLFFTVNTEDTLYIYDLTGTTIPTGFPNPFPITNSILNALFGGGDFFESPTAVAVTGDPEKAALFVLNDNGTDSSVRRLYVNLTTWVPASPLTIATMTESSRRLVDLAHYGETDALFVSKKVVEGIGVAGWVYRIVNASDRTGSLNLDSATAFIEEFVSFTGLEVAFGDKQGTTADLLVLREEVGMAVQFDILQQGTAKAVLDFSSLFLYPQTIGYDCTNRRLVMTDVPVNDDFDRTLFEVFPSQ